MTGKKRVVSGMRPTGKLHLGHLVGALQNWVALQEQYDSFYFVADWHALTSDYADTSGLVTYAYDNVIDWIAAGRNKVKGDGSQNGNQQVARRTGGGHQGIVSPRMSQVSHNHRRGFRPADHRDAANDGEQRKHDRANGINVHERVERHAAEPARGVIAKPAGGPRMRRLVNRQGKDEDEKFNEDRRNIDRGQVGSV